MTPAKLVDVLGCWQRMLGDATRADPPSRAALVELDREIGYALVDAIRERTRLETEGKGAPWK